VRKQWNEAVLLFLNLMEQSVIKMKALEGTCPNYGCPYQVQRLWSQHGFLKTEERLTAIYHHDGFKDRRG
jgi:hypothetical protein